MSIGRSKAHPQSVALSAFQFCFARDISLKSQWIPRSLNEKAGQLSRFVDKDDWSLNPSVFQLVDAKWGPPQSTVSQPITMLSSRDLTRSSLPLVPEG